MDKPQRTVFEFGPFRLETARRRLMRDGTPVALTSRAYEMLLIFVRNSGKAVTKESLLKELWPDTFVEEGNLAVNVSALRKALGEEKDDRKYIVTVPRVGYRFAAEVRAVPDVIPESQDSDRVSQTVAPGGADNDAEGETPIVPVQEGEREDIKTRAAGEVPKPSFIQRLKDEVRKHPYLLSLPGLVLLMAALAVAINISGKNFTRSPSDLIAVENETVNRISEYLGAKLSRNERQRMADNSTSNTEAHRLYLMGRHFWNKRSIEGFIKGLEYFQRAIVEDSDYALAYAGMADCYGLLGAYMIKPADEAFPAARAAALKALELNNELAEAHTSLALIHWLYDWDWQKADNAFRRASQLNPNYALARHWRGLFLGEMGRFNEAVAEMQLALELDPTSAPIYADYGRVLFWARRYPEAVEKYHKARELEPQLGAYFPEISKLYEQAEMTREFASLYEGTQLLSSEQKRAFRAEGFKGLWRAQIGPNSGIDRAELFAMLGEKEKAFADLSQAYAQRDHRISQLKVNPAFDSLRADPRFAELLRKMNLTP